jgi:hypothetical protein
MNNSKQEILYGKNAVLEALRNLRVSQADETSAAGGMHSRSRSLDTLYVSQSAKGLGEHIALAKEAGAVVKTVSPEKIEQLAGDKDARTGGVVATFGVVAPSMVIITLIAAFLQNFAHIEFVRHAFAGVRVGVCVLVLNAVVKLWKKSVKDVPGFLIFAVILALVVFLDLSPVFMVLGAGIAGVCIQGARRAVRK